jgi:hypothetical protein
MHASQRAACSARRQLLLLVVRASLPFVTYIQSSATQGPKFTQHTRCPSIARPPGNLTS